MAEMMMNDGKKWIEKDDYASKGVANTALGLSIGALGYELLKNGGLNLGNILGGGSQTNPEETAFGLYKGYRDGYDVLKAQIDELKSKMAVTETNQFWQMKNVTDQIALEAERRACNDGKIVNYVNTTFVPKYIADMTVGTGTTQQAIFNPLCTPNCGC